MIIKATMGEQEKEIWQFAVELYGMPRVAECCIFLQDQCAVDVVHLIFLLFMLDANGFRADRQFVRRSRHVCDEWRSKVIIPLRQVRRDLKPMESGDIEGAREFRHEIKSLELQAERLQLNYLLRWRMDESCKTLTQRATPAREAGRLIREVAFGAQENAVFDGDIEKADDAIETIAAALTLMPDREIKPEL